MAGFAGLCYLGQGAFVGVGAYTGGILAVRWRSPLLVAPLGGVAAAFVAFLLGLDNKAGTGHRVRHRDVRDAGGSGLVVRNWKSLTGGSQGFLMPLPSWAIHITELALLLLPVQRFLLLTVR